MRGIALLLLLAGCQGAKYRPFADLDLGAHRDPGVSSVAGGVTLLTDDGMRVKVGPRVQFDFMGDEAMDNRQFGGVVSIDWVR